MSAFRDFRFSVFSGSKLRKCRHGLLADVGELGGVGDHFVAFGIFPFDRDVIPSDIDDAAGDKAVALAPAHVPDDFAGPINEEGRFGRVHDRPLEPE